MWAEGCGRDTRCTTNHNKSERERVMVIEEEKFCLDTRHKKKKLLFGVREKGKEKNVYNVCPLKESIL